MSRARNPWARVGWDAWALSMEAASVMALRSLKIAKGDAAARAEAERMVSEKVDAALSLQAMALAGGLGFSAPKASAKVLAHYRRKVRANRRRLAK